MEQTKIQQLLKEVDGLGKGERTALKRNAGLMLNEADGKAIRAFYRCLPYTVQQKEDRYFAAACFHCLWDAEETRIPLEEAFYRLGKDDELSDSMGHRLEVMLDLSWDEDGFLLGKLSRMMKLVKSKGIAVNCEALLQDLLCWNYDTKIVQKKWAKALYMEHKGE